MPSCHAWSHAHYCDAASVEIAQFAEVVADADPTTRVPTCPEWTISDLIEHMGGIHRWVERMVTEQTPTRIPRQLIELGLPLSQADYPDWLARGGPPLIDALRRADPDAQMWAWGADQHVRFWSLFETAVHRIDAELALGREVHIKPDMAVDGIDELLDNLPGAAYFAPNVADLRGDHGQTLAFQAADTGDTWLVELLPDGFAWRHDARAAPASVTVRANAAVLYVVLWRRRPVHRPEIEVSGDEPVLVRWIDRSTL
ncbi:MAG: maleylpyruvate isomerase family mycothiol-dependent enzyme [Chloroflexi bacterium]|nr:maleylpyruvate isomerase family mycothiol-dependent enzyme [Chloroflexota bacterium]